MVIGNLSVLHSLLLWWLEWICVVGGLDEALHNIIEMCQGQNIPFMFALSRKQLGKACCKVVPVSVVGIFSYEGAEVTVEIFNFSVVLYT